MSETAAELNETATKIEDEPQSLRDDLVKKNEKNSIR